MVTEQDLVFLKQLIVPSQPLTEHCTNKQITR